MKFFEEPINYPFLSTIFFLKVYNFVAKNVYYDVL